MLLESEYLLQNEAKTLCFTVFFDHQGAENKVKTHFLNMFAHTYSANSIDPKALQSTNKGHLEKEN